jgi:hypothetical protein
MAFSYQNYTGNGTTTQFSITFTYQNTSEISVTVDGVAETGLTFPSSSTVQLTTAPAIGTLVQVRRTTALASRAVDFASGSVLTEEDLDDSNIQVFHAAQESADLAADSIQLDNDNKWDAQNSVIKNVGTPTASTDAATKGYTDTEVAGVVSSSVSQATAAAVSAANTAVATATGNIIPDATKLAIHPIGTQYTLSDGVTSDYSSKHYANVASTNATTATNAASAASTDAGTASTAATAAQVAQAAAEAALDTFDDRFLGAKASDPSVDNDGNALLDGAIYFNTTSDIMKVYDQANTIWRDLALTGTNQTNVNLVAGQISPTNNIATVAGISADITTTATNNANITTVATSIADVNAVGTDIANVNTVATNLTSVNAFADTYFISATAPASPTLGDLWFDTTNNVMKVYSASGFVNAGSSVNGTANRYVYTATASQTTFAATYDAGYIDVYLNGVKLQNGTDFTATDGANVVLTVGAALNDQIDIVGYGTFNIAIPDISGDLTPTLGGDLATSGNDITFGDNDKAIFGAGNDLQIYHDGGQSVIRDYGYGHLRIQAGDLRLENADGTATYLAADNGAALYAYHAGNVKLTTTATGVDVTGTVTASGDIIRNDTTTGTSKFALQYSGADAAVFKRNNATGVATIANGYAGAPVDAINISLAGNVGIGITNPVYNLVVSAGGASGIEFGPAYSGTANLVQHYSRSGAAYVDAVNIAAQHRFNIGGSEAMRIDSSGNVMIGTNSSSVPFYVYNTGFTGGQGTANTYTVAQVQTSTNTSGLFFGGMSTETTAVIGTTTGSGNLAFQTYNGSSWGERMRIDSSGNLLVGTTSQILGSTGVAGVQVGSSFVSIGKTGTSSNTMMTFNNGNGQVGAISTAGSSTSYGTSSDYRLKTAVNYDWDATTRLKQLRPARFEWIVDGDDAVPVDGFLAHEVQDIVPEAISGTHNGMRDEKYQVSAATGDIYTPAIEAVLDEDGNEVTPAVAEVIHSTDVERPEELAEGQQWRETTATVMGTRSVPDYQGIDQSKLVPLLVKTIQELEARIAALENV